MEINIETKIHIKKIGKLIQLKCINCDKPVTYENLFYQIELRHIQCPKCKKNFYHLTERYKYCVKDKSNHKYVLKQCETGDTVKLFNYKIEVLQNEA